MPSSISSFDTAAKRLPQLPWVKLLGGALLLAGAFVLLMESALALRGFRPTIVDSQAQWAKQRARAAQLGSRALILVGDSRMQTDLDLDVLRAGSKLEPVELALDGSSFVPVLAGLARDSEVTGTVLVGFSDVEVMRQDAASAATRYETAYEKNSTATAAAWTYRNIEAALGDRLHAVLASYADGAGPLHTLLLRVLDPSATPQSMVTQPDRTRVIDYSRANLRSLRVRSALFELDGTAAAKLTADLDRHELALRNRIAQLQPADEKVYLQRSREIENLTRAIERRGGRVVFVRLPVAGNVTRIDEILYPRDRFWNQFVGISSAACLRTDDESTLREFTPPDDLHLDQRDRRAFSARLIAAAMSAAPCKAATK